METIKNILGFIFAAIFLTNGEVKMLKAVEHFKNFLNKKDFEYVRQFFIFQLFRNGLRNFLMGVFFYHFTYHANLLSGLISMFIIFFTFIVIERFFLKK